MKIIIIGGVAAGTSAGAKARRNDEDAEITIYEKDSYISYSACGMPYFLGEEVESIDSLTPRDPMFFKKKYNIQVNTGFLVEKINSEGKEITVQNLSTGEVFLDHYDKLILSTGATAFVPEIEGSDLSHVFSLRNIHDILKIKGYLDTNKPYKAVIVGTGFIGFEMAENLLQLGIEVDMVELGESITANLDGDMAWYLQQEVEKKGVGIHTNCGIENISTSQVTLSSGEVLEADLVILATGVRPNTLLAEETGIALGETAGILVDDKMETNIPHIYACGDCIETFSAISGKGVYLPLGSTANKTGRIAGDVVTGGSLRYKGTLGTGIFKFFDLTVATTGFSEKEALKHGYAVKNLQVCHNIKPNKPEYLGGQEMTIKAVADRKTSRILGVQIIGREGVDKRIDVFATLITYKATVDELFHLDLAYAPPFSTTKDPVHYTGMILDNAINNNRPLITTEELKKRENSGEKLQIVDARSPSDFEKKGSVSGAVNIPQAKLRESGLPLDKNVPTVTFCNKGVTGNAAQNILLGQGFTQVFNLSGGHKFNKITEKNKNK